MLTVYKLKVASRTQCAGCHHAIIRDEEYVLIEGMKLHPFCAVDDNHVQACSECFMLRCECDDK